MIIDIKYAQLEAPAFVRAGSQGINLGDKLDSELGEKRVKMVFDSELDCLIVIFNGNVGLVPQELVRYMTPVDNDVVLEHIAKQRGDAKVAKKTKAE